MYLKTDSTMEQQYSIHICKAKMWTIPQSMYTIDIFKIIYTLKIIQE